ncbi:MAG: helix-turn-helix transcriptional regulator [Clostridia bacterium]|nr:helix-turn-helix transcriptional regulator [Clostridia bacterium]
MEKEDDCMPIIYKKPILPELKAAGYSTARLRKEKIIGEATIQQLREGKLVSWRLMEMICKILQCQPGDLLEYVEDEPETAQQNPEAKETTP